MSTELFDKATLDHINEEEIPWVGPGDDLTSDQIDFMVANDKWSTILKVSWAERAGGFQLADLPIHEYLKVDNHGLVFSYRPPFDVDDKEEAFYLGRYANKEELKVIILDFITYGGYEITAAAIHFDDKLFYNAQFQDELFIAASAFINSYYEFSLTNLSEEFKIEIGARLAKESAIYRGAMEFFMDPRSPKYKDLIENFLEVGFEDFYSELKKSGS